MDLVSVGALFTSGVSALGGVIWAVKQGGRIDTHEQRFEDREKLDVLRHEALVSRLDRIERKQDQQNSGDKHGG